MKSLLLGTSCLALMALGVVVSMSEADAKPQIDCKIVRMTKEWKQKCEYNGDKGDNRDKGKSNYTRPEPTPQPEPEPEPEKPTPEPEPEKPTPEPEKPTPEGPKC